MTNHHDKHHEHNHEHHIHEHNINLESMPLECDGNGHQHHHHDDGTCCCELHAREFHGIDKKMLLRLIIAAICFIVPLILPERIRTETLEFVFYLFCAVIAGYDIIIRALKNLIKGKLFDEYFLMSFAAIVAFCIGEYEEAAAVFLLFRIGAFCQNYAIRKSSNTISSKTGDWGLSSHEAEINTPYITRFAKIYTPVILSLAVIISFSLPLITDTSIKDSIYRALSFLVLACPCAIVISVQLTYTAAIASATKKGIFISNSKAIDIIAGNNTSVDQENIKYNEKSNSIYIYYQNIEKPEVILTDTDKTTLDLRKLTLIQISKKAKKIILENIWFTITIKLIVLILSVFGVSALWIAVFADSGVTIIAVLNSLRAFINR